MLRHIAAPSESIPTRAYDEPRFRPARVLPVNHSRAAGVAVESTGSSYPAKKHENHEDDEALYGHAGSAPTSSSISTINRIVRSIAALQFVLLVRGAGKRRARA
jgi:hypothetical protein